MNAVEQAASVIANKEQRVKLLRQTEQIVQDFAHLLSNILDRLVKGDFFQGQLGLEQGR